MEAEWQLVNIINHEDMFAVEGRTAAIPFAIE